MEPISFGFRIIGDLPFYIPVPEDTHYDNLDEVPKTRFLFRHITPPQTQGTNFAQGVDDGRGNYIFTQLTIEFAVNGDTVNDTKPYVQKAIELTNELLTAIKYESKYQSIRNITEFVQHKVEILKRDPVTNELIIEGENAFSFGPHGIKPLGTLRPESMRKVWLYFKRDLPIYPSRLLLTDSVFNLEVGDIPRAILDIATALEIHIPALIENYVIKDVHLKDISVEDVIVYKLYDKILKKATSHTLHEKPELYIGLEFIRQVRNSITHNWKPEFRITKRFRASRYLDKHLALDGHLVTSRHEVDKMREDAANIVDFATRCFEEKYRPISGIASPPSS